MLDKQLIEIDLNLLKVLRVLLEERSVTRTAERLFVSQPAVSKSLARLRQLFGDPLLMRSAQGLVPTPRGMELTVAVADAITQLETLWRPVVFDPAEAHGRILIGGPESFLLEMSSRLVECVRATAPHLVIEFLHLEEDYVTALAAGSLDFVIYHKQAHPPGIVCQELMWESLQLWTARSHPLSTVEVITLEDLCRFPFVRFHSAHTTQDAIDHFDRAIAEAGLQRTTLANTSHLLIALNLLIRTDATMIAPKHLSPSSILVPEVVSRSLGHIPLFRHKTMCMHMALIQHERTATSPLHQWIATEIRKLFLALNAGGKPRTNHPKSPRQGAHLHSMSDPASH